MAKLSCQMDAAASLTIDQRRVCAIFHELHNHGEMALSAKKENRKSHGRQRTQQNKTLECHAAVDGLR